VVDTKRVTHRRTLHLSSIEEHSAEVDRVLAAHAAGELRTLGNWSAAQILQHIGRLIEFALDGFPFRYPWYYRAATWQLKFVAWRWLLARAFRPGFRNPPVAAALEPDPHLSLETAANYLRGPLARLAAGEQMTHPSPAEGRISHAQWLEAQLRHAELHLSFLDFPARAPNSATG
jgi:hypothetical protein